MAAVEHLPRRRRMKASQHLVDDEKPQQAPELPEKAPEEPQPNVNQEKDNPKFATGLPILSLLSGILIFGVITFLIVSVISLYNDNKALYNDYKAINDDNKNLFNDNTVLREKILDLNIQIRNDEAEARRKQVATEFDYRKKFSDLKTDFEKLKYDKITTISEDNDNLKQTIANMEIEVESLKSKIKERESSLKVGLCNEHRHNENDSSPSQRDFNAE